MIQKAMGVSMATSIQMMLLVIQTGKEPNQLPKSHRLEMFAPIFAVYSKFLTLYMKQHFSYDLLHFPVVGLILYIKYLMILFKKKKKISSQLSVKRMKDIYFFSQATHAI